MIPAVPHPLHQEHPNPARAVTSFALKPAVKTASRNDLRYGIGTFRFGFAGGVQSGSRSACGVVGSGCTGEKGTATMPARSGQAYVESLKKNAPCVYLGGRRIPDVTAEPIFQEPIRAIAEQYDMQLDPAYRDIMTYPSPSTGELVSTSFLVPRTREDLVKKRKHFKLRADHNFGFLGRAPDFMNQFVTGWHLMADRFARAGAPFGDNATRYYEHVREHDLFLTHMLINPQVDRSKTSAAQADPYLHLGRVRETSDGIVVRGAKMLGTMAPLTEEVAVIPFGGIPPGDDAYALVFAIPAATPGLTFICRETVSPLPRSRFDHPLSSRFEEMDCIAVFEDV